MWEILFALLSGILAGTITGLAPGIHINLVAAFLVFSLPNLSFISPIALAVFIAAMSIAHTFIDFIPSIYLGAPEEDSFLSVLPGHEMLQEGKGHEAFVITLYGSLAALAIILIFAPLFVLFLPSLFAIIKTAIPFVLIFISLYLIFREKQLLTSFIIFLLAGALGFLAFHLPVKEPLMPLLSGLFGLSSILISINTNAKIQAQKIPCMREIKIEKKTLLKSLGAVIISSPFCSFLPGIGSGHAATIGSEIIPQNRKGFLFLVGATNTIIMGLSFVALYAINKTRSGSAAAVKGILQNFTLHDLIVILTAIIVAGVLAAVLGIALSKFAAKNINKINYKLLNISILAIIVIFNIAFSNWIGILVLLTSASLGVFAILSGSRRINLMGALIIPSILYYLL
jgi:putative membrane protein